MPLHTVNERTGSEWTVSFSDNEWQPSVPSTVHWRLICDHCGEVVVDWTAATIDEGDEITSLIQISGVDTTIHSRTNTREKKRVLVVANKDQAREASFDWSFYVQRVGRT